MSNSEQADNRNTDIFKKIQNGVFMIISVYASFAGIISFNDDIKKLMATPSKIDEVKKSQDEIRNSIETVNKNCISQNIDEIKKDQDRITANIAMITQSTTVNHKDIIDNDGFFKIKVRRADKEKNQDDKTSVYYDKSSSFFQVLKEGDSAYKDYKVIFKGVDIEYDPTIVVDIRKTNNIEGNTETDITFQVSQAVFTLLGGNAKSNLLTVKAKLINKKQEE
ncbi:MAG: hypothetical protein RI964_182 [Pseudomonadota bacterium]|jgi:hypothetical protein